MDEDDAVDRGRGQRQQRGLDQGGGGQALMRPVHHALRGRHEGDHPLRIHAENGDTEVGNGSVSSLSFIRALSGDGMLCRGLAGLMVGFCGQL